jgi:hypothetical protein
MTTREQLESFQSFASDQLDRGGDELTLDQLYHLWRSRHPTSEELVESVSALNAAYAELLAGDEGVPARKALRESCRHLGLVID